MQAYVCKELNKGIIYLSPMHITQRAIISFDVSDAHDRLVNLDKMKQMELRVRMQCKFKYNVGMYIYRAMK
jgi:hypothetical protein